MIIDTCVHTIIYCYIFPGLIPRSIVHVFEGKEAEEDEDTIFDVRVSYIEIYNEEIRDLLGEDPTQKLEIKVNFHKSSSSETLYIFSKTRWKVLQCTWWRISPCVHSCYAKGLQTGWKD